MTRILFWLALVFLVMFAIRSKLKGAQPRRQPPAPPQQAPAGRAQQRAARAAAEAETMLCCAHCGIYFPASEAVQAKGLDYCSPAHASLPAP